MGDRLDTDQPGLLGWQVFVMGCRSFSLGRRVPPSAFVSAWRWYWDAAEEALALA